MIKGIYTAASGMIASQINMDNMADNLANVNTVGFKRRGSTFQAFPQLLMQRLVGNKSQEIGALNTGTQVRQTTIAFEQGSLRQTGNTFDVALQGEGFFQIQLANGETGYTRNGSFHVDENGLLTTSAGQAVLNNGGVPITVPLGSESFTIGENGAIQGSLSGEVGRIGVVRFENQNQLGKLSDSIFVSAEEPIPLEAGGQTVIQQGFLELSNTNVVAEMIQSISGVRLYQSLQKNMQLHNDTLGKAVNEVGRIQ